MRNPKNPKIGSQLKIKPPADFIAYSGPSTDNVSSPMVLLEQAIDSLIQRINAQTQRIKDMV